MRRHLWTASVLLLVISAEKCIETPPSPANFTCGTESVPEADLEDCRRTSSDITCQYHYQQDVTTKNWTLISVGHNIFNTTENCFNEDPTGRRVYCVTNNCTVVPEDVEQRCIVETTSIQPDGDDVTPGNKHGPCHVLPKEAPAHKRGPFCVVTMQNGTIEAESRDASYIKTDDAAECNWVNGTMFYLCNYRDCDLKLNNSQIARNCNGTRFQCGHLTYSFVKRNPYCIYEWTWDDNGAMVKKGDPFLFSSLRRIPPCYEHSEDQVMVACSDEGRETGECANVTLAQTSSERYCAAEIRANNASRKIIKICGSIFFVVLSLSVVTCGSYAMIKARNERAMLQVAYDGEFGSNPIATSGSHDKKKKKGKEKPKDGRKGGTKAKK
ncbi:hypothetical protein PFISCL1PPCAC_2502 [Pristionchus fissidentatus]|uniref:Uncharacterized protein n=1 Tax=Pristionchus fissidentatus TaxID=1538716 RepID=A0AAV5V064_9BILA|nr:hypothetical protein PFISCL1PPCAC_2502 [Pristionchus fissidentatus]